MCNHVATASLSSLSLERFAYGWKLNWISNEDESRYHQIDISCPAKQAGSINSVDMLTLYCMYYTSIKKKEMTSTVPYAGRVSVAKFGGSNTDSSLDPRPLKSFNTQPWTHQPTHSLYRSLIHFCLNDFRLSLFISSPALRMMMV